MRPSAGSFLRDPADRLLLHFCGHVHDGAFTAEGVYKPYSVIGNHTLSINSGGGEQHDGEKGIRMLIVDAKGVAAARKAGTLEANAEQFIEEV